VHERGHLGRPEAQLLRPELDHLAYGPQPRQRQPRINSRNDHQLGRWRQMEQQQRDLVEAGWILDHMTVIEDQNNRFRERGQLVDQRREHPSTDVRPTLDP